MPNFVFTGTVHIGVFTEVEAETKEEAAKIAENRMCQSICSQCSSADKDSEWTFEDNPTWSLIDNIEIAE